MLQKFKIIYLIAKWEFKEKFLHKSFLISFALSQFLLFISLYFINSTSTNLQSNAYPIAIVTDSLNSSSINLKGDDFKYFFVKVKKEDYLNKQNLLDVPKVLNNSFIACVEISGNNIKFNFSSLLNNTEIVDLQNNLYKLINSEYVVSSKIVNINKQISENKILSHIGIVLIFIFTILISSNLFLRGFSIEKDSKLLEILLSSTKLENILTGKAIGLFLFVMIQFIFWFLISLLSNKTIFFEVFVSIDIYILLATEVLFYIMFFLTASLASKHESDINIVLSSITFFLLLPFLFIDKLIFFDKSIFSYFLIYFPFTSFSSFVIKSVNLHNGFFEILFALLIQLISILSIIIFIKKYLKTESLTNSIFSFTAKWNKK